MSFKDLAIDLQMEKEEYLEMIALFLEISAKDLTDLQSALERGDGPRAANAAHSIKGASSNLGLMQIYELAQKIETEARENHSDRNSERVLMLRERLDHLTEEFKQESNDKERGDPLSMEKGGT